MSKLLVASVACLLSISISSLVRAEETLVAQDPFGEFEEAKVDRETMDPDGAGDPQDPFGSAAATGERGKGMGRGMPMSNGRERGMGITRGMIDLEAARAAVAARGAVGYGEARVSPPGTYTIISEGKMQLLLDTMNGKSWRLSNEAGGMKWVEIEKVQPAAPPTTDVERLGQQEADIGNRSATPTAQIDALGRLRARYNQLDQAYDSLDEKNAKQDSMMLKIVRESEQRLESVKQKSKLMQEKLETQISRLVIEHHKEIKDLKEQLHQAEANDAAKILPEPTASETPEPAKSE